MPGTATAPAPSKKSSKKSAAKNNAANRPGRPHATEIKARAGSVSDPREGSKRAQLLETLRKSGMTLEQMEKKFDWKQRDAMDALRLLARVNHVPVKQDDHGKWHAAK
jgi:hypothetical protein